MIDVRTANAVAAGRGDVRMIVETVPPTQASGAAVTHVDVAEGFAWVVTSAVVRGSPIQLHANHGVTITGDTIEPIRASRIMLSPHTK